MLEHKSAQISVAPKSANERYSAKRILTLSANPGFLTILLKISISTNSCGIQPQPHETIPPTSRNHPLNQER